MERAYAGSEISLVILLFSLTKKSKKKKEIKFDDRTTFIQHKGNMPASVKIALFNHKSKLQLKRRTSPYEELGHYIKVISLSSLLIQHKRQSL